MSDEDDQMPRITLAMHGDLDKLNVRQLVSLRRVLMAGGRAIDREVKREARRPLKKWWMAYLRTLWFGMLPFVGLFWWGWSIWTYTLVPLSHEWYVQLVWVLLRALWGPR